MVVRQDGIDPLALKKGREVLIEDPLGLVGLCAHVLSPVKGWAEAGQGRIPAPPF